MGRPGTSCAGTPSCWRSPPRPPIWTPGVPAPGPSRVLLLPEDILVGDADLELSGFDSGQCSMPNAIRAVSPRTEEPLRERLAGAVGALEALRAVALLVVGVAFLVPAPAADVLVALGEAQRNFLGAESRIDAARDLAPLGGRDGILAHPPSGLLRLREDRVQDAAELVHAGSRCACRFCVVKQLVEVRRAERGQGQRTHGFRDHILPESLALA